jgi:hypothetical protein
MMVKRDFNLGLIMELDPDLHHGIVSKSEYYENNRYKHHAGVLVNTNFCTGTRPGRYVENCKSDRVSGRCTDREFQQMLV